MESTLTHLVAVALAVLVVALIVYIIVNARAQRRLQQELQQEISRRGAELARANEKISDQSESESKFDVRDSRITARYGRRAVRVGTDRLPVRHAARTTLTFARVGLRRA